MNILIIHNSYQMHGGEDEVVRTETSMLERCGHKVTLFERCNADINRLSMVSKIQFVLQDILWSKRTYDNIKEVIKTKRPDLVHVHNTFFVVSPSVYAACYEEGVPIVQTLHNFRFLCPIGTFYRNGRVCEDCLRWGKKAVVFNRCWRNSLFFSFNLYRVIKKVEKGSILLKTVDRFIVLSQFSKQKYISNGFPEERMTVRPNAVEYSPIKSTRMGRYALFVGALRDYKGIETLTNAWHVLKDPLLLKIIGDGPLRDRVKNSSSVSNIEYLGERSFDETMDAIKHARFLVVPSECYENFPRVIVEAFAYGVPVVGSRIGALEELIEHGRTGLLFEPGNIVELAHVLRTLIDDKEMLMAMKKHARQEYEAKYGFHDSYASLIEIYNKAISRVAERRELKKPEMYA